MARKKKGNKKSKNKAMTTSGALGSNNNAAEESSSSNTFSEEATPNVTVADTEQPDSSCCAAGKTDEGIVNDSGTEKSNVAEKNEETTTKESTETPPTSVSCPSPRKEPPTADQKSDKSPSKEALKNCCANKTSTDETKSEPNPPPSGSCCKNKDSSSANDNGNKSVGTSTPTSTCCGCGDDCRCCIENGWANCQCGPSCKCSDPLLSEQASLLMECAGQKPSILQDDSVQNSSSVTQSMDISDPLRNQTNHKQSSVDDVEAPQQQMAIKSPLYIDIVVGGMTCTMCSQAIINAVQMLDGVLSVNVSLVNDVAHVELDPEQIQNYDAKVEEIEENISDIGYQVVDKITMSKEEQDSSNNGTKQGASNNDSQDSDPPQSSNNNSSQQDRWNLIARRQEEKLQKKKRAFISSLFGTIPILFLTMILPHALPEDNAIVHWLHDHYVHVFHKRIPLESLVLWLLATPVEFVSGWEFFQSTYYSLFRTGTWGMDLLVVLGTLSSYGYALYGMLSDQFQQSHFFETSAVLISFVLLGKWMQALAVHRTSDALNKLMQLQPSTAIRVLPVEASNVGNDWDPLKVAYHEETVTTSNLQRGDIVKIVPGASLPADGVVVVGELSVDESMVTGESLPVLKTKGSMVLGGTVCVESSAVNGNAAANSQNTSKGHATTGQVAFCRVTGVGSSTALSQIIKLVQDAQASKVPMQNFADTVSSIFVPVVVTLSLITFLIWYALCSSGVVPEEWYTDLNENSATFSLMFGISCLVISCPCALGLALPTALMVGTGLGAKLGILMKGGEALEAASKVNAVVLDKTGTVTTGKPVVTDFFPLTSKSDGNSCDEKRKKEAPSSGGNKPLSKENILWLVGSLERSSEHPLAKAIVAYAESMLSEQTRAGSSYLEEFPFLQPSDFRSSTGRGASGYLQRDSKDGSVQYFVALGNRAFFSSLEMEVSLDVDARMKELEKQGKTAILAAVDHQFCAVLGIADQLRPDAAQSVAYLRKMKIDVWLVTGDNARTAQAIAQQLNLPPQRVVSEALPNAKVHQVRKLQQQGKVVAMVGDGTNDAPALAQANVGIGMGAGTAIAAEAADMVLVKGQYVADLCVALDLCRVIFARIKWNFLWALVYNCLGIPVAAGVAFPLFHTRLPPTVAGLAMALSSVSVVCSSLALRFYKPPSIGNTVSPTRGNTNNATSSAESDVPATERGNPRAQHPVTRLSLDMGTDSSKNYENQSDLTRPLLSNDQFSDDAAAAGEQV